MASERFGPLNSMAARQEGQGLMCRAQGAGWGRSLTLTLTYPLHQPGMGVTLPEALPGPGLGEKNCAVWAPAPQQAGGEGRGAGAGACPG